MLEFEEKKVISLNGLNDARSEYNIIFNEFITSNFPTEEKGIWYFISKKTLNDHRNEPKKRQFTN